MAPHVVIGQRLSALTVSGLSGVPADDRAFYPAFDPDTLHYAARCTASVTLTLTPEDTDTRLSVNSVQRPKGEAFTVDSLGFESDIRITLTGPTGASTTYTVHCIDRTEFPKLTTVKADGATEDLMMFSAKWRRSDVGWRCSLIMMDNNDGDIIAGFRFCSKILRIDGDTGDVVWRTGPSILSREQWKAGETVQRCRKSPHRM